MNNQKEKLKLSKALQSLQRFQEIVRLHDEQHVKFSVIARSLGISRERVRQIYHDPRWRKYADLVSTEP